jgi:hypothetical protein
MCDDDDDKRWRFHAFTHRESRHFLCFLVSFISSCISSLYSLSLRVSTSALLAANDLYLIVDNSFPWHRIIFFAWLSCV